MEANPVAKLSSDNTVPGRYRRHVAFPPDREIQEALLKVQIRSAYLQTLIPSRGTRRRRNGRIGATQRGDQKNKDEDFFQVALQSISRRHMIERKLFI